MCRAEAAARSPEQLHKAACSIASDAQANVADAAGNGALVHVSGAVLRQQHSCCLSTSGQQALQHVRMSHDGHRLVLGSQLLGQGGFAPVYRGQVC